MTNTIGSLELFPPSGGGGSGSITHIQGTNGVNVPPNLAGTVFLTFANNEGFINGNAGTNTLTFSLNVVPNNTGVLIFHSSGPQTFTSVNGNAGQILVSEGAGTSPTFQSITGSSPITVTSTGGSIVIGISGGIATTFVEDMGTAIPFGGVLNILGGKGISTLGSGSTVTISLSGSGTFASDGVIYWNGSSFATTSSGSSGQILVSQDGSGGPSYQTITGSSAVTVISTGGTIVISGSGSIATSFVEDTGTATPLNGILNILGSTGISTLGSGSTVTISLSGSGTFASNGVIYWNGSSFATTSSGSSGQILVSQDGSGGPSYQTITGSSAVTVISTGGTIVISGSGSIATSFVENTGTATPTNGILNILGSTGISTLGSGSTVTISLSGSGTFASDGVIYWNGSSFATTSSGSSGQILVSQDGSGGPSYQTITGSSSVTVISTGGTIVISGSNSAASSFVENSGTATPTNGILNILGGTGISTLGSGSTVTISLSGSGAFASDGVVYWNGTSLSTVTGPSGDVLVVNTVGQPQFVMIQGTQGISVTSNGGNITIAANGNIAEIFKGNTGTAFPSSFTINVVGSDGIITTAASGNAVAISLSGTVPVTHGGTGNTFLTAGEILIGNGASPVKGVILNSTQILQGSNLNLPQPAILVNGTGIQIVNDSTTNPGTITILATGSTVGFSWQHISSNTTLMSNNGYICSGGSSLTLTLPSTSNLGDIIEVTADSTSSWVIVPQSGTTQTVQCGSHVTSTSGDGALTSGLGDSVRMVCSTGAANAQQWIVLSAIGTLVVTYS
jgi:hypothetical protein